MNFKVGAFADKAIKRAAAGKLGSRFYFDPAVTALLQLLTI